MNYQEFVSEYAAQLNQSDELRKCCPEYEDINTCTTVAKKMLKAVFEAKYPADWFRDSPAMRKAARKFGWKTSKEFRPVVKSWKEAGEYGQ